MKILNWIHSKNNKIFFHPTHHNCISLAEPLKKILENEMGLKPTAKQKISKLKYLVLKIEALIISIVGNLGYLLNLGDLKRSLVQNHRSVKEVFPGCKVYTPLHFYVQHMATC